jgi:hypothetical protein
MAASTIALDQVDRRDRDGAPDHGLMPGGSDAIRSAIDDWSSTVAAIPNRSRSSRPCVAEAGWADDQGARPIRVQPIPTG